MSAASHGKLCVPVVNVRKQGKVKKKIKSCIIIYLNSSLCSFLPLEQRFVITVTQFFLFLPSLNLDYVQCEGNISTRSRKKKKPIGNASYNHLEYVIWCLVKSDGEEENKHSHELKKKEIKLKLLLNSGYKNKVFYELNKMIYKQVNAPFEPLFQILKSNQLMLANILTGLVQTSKVS